MNAIRLIRLFAPVVVFASLINGQNMTDAMPYLDQTPTITFSETGAAPVYNRIPIVCDNVGINLVNASGQYMSIESLVLRNDTLFVVPSQLILIIPLQQSIVAPIYEGTTISFDRAKIYKAVKVSNVGVGTASSLGSFVIKPKFSTNPVSPYSGSPITLNLTMGETHSACPPTYSNVSYVKNGKSIMLGFTETMPTICVAMYVDPAQPYGPTFSLGQLDTGTYSLYVRDTVFIGSFTVGTSYSLDGSAMIMKNPLTRMMALPVPDAHIVGVTYNTCSWYYSEPTIDSSSTYTGQDGSFLLTLPRISKQYTVTANASGYYPQSIAIPSDKTNLTPAKFELIPTTATPQANLTISAIRNGAPIESVYVSLSGGWPMMICAYMDAPAKETKAAAIAAASNYSGYTNKMGRLSFPSMSLEPWIDYEYFAYVNKPSYQRKDGKIRLNRLIDNTLTIDFSTTKINPVAKANSASRLTVKAVQRNIFTITLGEKAYTGDRIGIVDISGRTIASIKSADNSAIWDARRFAPGIYFVRVGSSGANTTLRLLVR